MVGCIDLNLNYSLIDGCPSYLNNVRQIWWIFVMYDRRHILWISISNEYHRCPMNTKMMNVHHLPIWWMSIIYENGECPSFKMYARRVLGCQSYMMDVHHIWGITVINVVCPSYIWANFMMEPKESFSRRIKCKRYDGLCSNGGTDEIGS